MFPNFRLYSQQALNIPLNYARYNPECNAAVFVGASTNKQHIIAPAGFAVVKAFMGDSPNAVHKIDKNNAAVDIRNLAHAVGLRF